MEFFRCLFENDEKVKYAFCDRICINDIFIFIHVLCEIQNLGSPSDRLNISKTHTLSLFIIFYHKYTKSLISAFSLFFLSFFVISFILSFRIRNGYKFYLEIKKKMHKLNNMIIRGPSSNLFNILIKLFYTYTVLFFTRNTDFFRKL